MEFGNIVLLSELQDPSMTSKTTVRVFGHIAHIDLTARSCQICHKNDFLDIRVDFVDLAS